VIDRRVLTDQVSQMQHFDRAWFQEAQNSAKRARPALPRIEQLLVSVPFLLLTFLNWQTAKAGIFWQTNACGVIEQAATIRPSEFSEGHVLRLCRSFLAAHRQAVVIRYLIVTDAQEALTNLRGPGITDIEFPGWRRFYLAQSRHPPPTAELIRIVDRASVRLRFLDGTIVERVIEGSSPLRIRFQGETVRILGATADRANTPRGVPPETAHLLSRSPAHGA